MKDLLRDALEEQILQDANSGDTTVLAEILSKFDDRYIFGCLGDEQQAKFKTYYDVHINIPKHGYSIGVVCPYPMDDQRVIDFAFENDLFEEEGDELYVDTIEEIDFEVWDEHFNPDRFRFMCNNCGGGFSREEIITYDDEDLCIGCSGDY